MDEEIGTSANLADLLVIYRQEIAEGVAKRALKIPGTRFGKVPADEFRTFIIQGINALVTVIKSQSDERLEQYAFDVGRQYATIGLDLSEVIEASLMFNEVVLPLIWRNFVPGSPEAYDAINELAVNIRHMLALFGHVYTDMMQRKLQDNQQHRDLMLDAAEASIQSGEPSEIGSQVASWLVNAVGARSCDIFLINPEKVTDPTQIEAKHLTAVSGTIPRERELSPELLALVWKVISQRVPLLTELADSTNAISPGGQQSPAKNNVLVLPLEAESQVFGVAILYTANNQPEFSDQNVELAVGITRAVTVAIVKARLYRLTRQHLAESQSLQRVTTALLEKLNLADILKIVCIEAQTLTSAKGSTVFLVEQERWLRVALSIGEAAFTVERIPLEGSFTGSAVRRGTIYISNNPAAELHRFATPMPATSILAAPLRAKGAVVGALDIVNKAGGFGDDDVRIMNLFADQAAIAIENTRLSERLEQLAVVEERQRLARDLHDSVTQTLYSVTLYADAAKWSLQAGNLSAASDHIQEVQSSSREALREMRLLIFELHPPELETEGLVPVLQGRLEAVEARAGLKASLHVEGERRLPMVIEEGLYRIAQEALNNVFKHASAHQVTVNLRFFDDDVTLEVKDDGIGFDPTGVSPGRLGLRGMEERVKKLGGTLNVDSASGKGTRVHVEVNARNVPQA